MNSSRTVISNHFTKQTNSQTLTNADMLSRQIKSLRIVLRRMKVTRSSSLDSLINQKLKEL